MVFLTLLDCALNVTIMTFQLGSMTTRYIYRLYNGREKTDYEKFVEFMEERDKKMLMEL